MFLLRFFPQYQFLQWAMCLAIRPAPSRSVAQPGRALRSGRRGRRFKSYHSDHGFTAPKRFLSSFTIAAEVNPGSTGPRSLFMTHIPSGSAAANGCCQQAQGSHHRRGGTGFGLADPARHLAVSERTLNRRFKLATGKAPLRYLQSLRVDVAKRLLEGRAARVEVVAARVGYHNLSTFRRLFRRETGLSPRDDQRRFAPPSHGRGSPAVRNHCRPGDRQTKLTLKATPAARSRPAPTIEDSAP
jgi:AraC-like DNA-binding protein